MSSPQCWTEARRSKLWEDFHTFAAAQIASKDCDPLYPVLRYVHSELCSDEEQKLWLTFLYVAYYNLPSALTVFRLHPWPDFILAEWAARLPTGIERRGLRGGAHMVAHLESLCKLGAPFSNWLQQGFITEDQDYRLVDPEHNWLQVQANLNEVWGNGRWAAYKTAEILQKVHDWPLVPTDMGHAWSSGPRKGLALLFEPLEGNTKEVIRQLDQQSDTLYDSLRSRDIPLDIAEAETVLCDFNSLCNGHYYVGHDIDQLLENTLAMKSEEDKQLILEARNSTLPYLYLGEYGADIVSGCYRWGVDPQRAKHYKLTGEILVR